MTSQMHRSTALSRRALVAGSAGWILGTAGLLLPASEDEADARKGADGGKLGGRHGKNHRGRRKDRDNNESDKDNEARHQTGWFGELNVAVEFGNASSTELLVQITGRDKSRYPDRWVYPGQSTMYRSPDTELEAVFGGVDVVAKNPTIGAPSLKFWEWEPKPNGTRLLRNYEYGLDVDEEMTVVLPQSGITLKIHRGKDEFYIDTEYKMLYVSRLN